MKTFEGFMTGVNLGGWISQYRQTDAAMQKEHFDTFLKEEDIKQIASWGMDHVRLPIDYMILEDDDNPLKYKEEGFAYVDKCIDWCEKYGLNIILDLHKAAGYSFNNFKESRLFDDEALKLRYISLWKAFAARYKKYGSSVVFELLNEIVEPDSRRWNALSKKTVEGIREIDADRIIIIGGNNYNSVRTLSELEPIADDNLVYTFHFYEPHMFTHQRASWEPLIKDLEFEVPYPSGQETYDKYLAKSEAFKKQYEYEEKIDKEYLRRYLKPAIDFIKERDVRLYCGEYGVIDHAPLDSNLRWHKDFCDLLLEYKIGRAVWTYKVMSFPMTDKESMVRSKELIKIVSSKA